MIARWKVSLKIKSCVFIEGKDKKKGGGPEEDVTPEEELHNFLQDLKKTKETREKFKAITGREAPRDLEMLAI